jgi:hypothetical protein
MVGVLAYLVSCHYLLYLILTFLSIGKLENPGYYYKIICKILKYSMLAIYQLLQILHKVVRKLYG